MAEEGFMLTQNFIDIIRDAIHDINAEEDGFEDNEDSAENIEFYVRLTEIADVDGGADAGQPVPYKAERVTFGAADTANKEWVPTDPVLNFDGGLPASPTNAPLYVYETGGTVGLEGQVHKITLRYHTDTSGGLPYWGFSINGDSQFALITSNDESGNHSAVHLDKALGSTDLVYDGGTDVTSLPLLIEVNGVNLPAGTIVVVEKKREFYYIEQSLSQELIAELTVDLGGGSYTADLLTAAGGLSGTLITLQILSNREHLVAERVLVHNIEGTYYGSWDDPTHLNVTIDSEDEPAGANGEFDALDGRGGSTLGQLRNFDALDGNFYHSKLIAINDSEETAVSTSLGLQITPIAGQSGVYKIEVLGDGGGTYGPPPETPEEPVIYPVEEDDSEDDPHDPDEVDPTDTPIVARLRLTDPMPSDTTVNSVCGSITNGFLYEVVAGSPITVAANGFIRCTAPSPGATISVVVRVRKNPGDVGTVLRGEFLIAYDEECPIEDEKADSEQACEEYGYVNDTTGETLNISVGLVEGAILSVFDSLESEVLTNNTLYNLPIEAFDDNGFPIPDTYTDEDSGDSITVSCVSAGTPVGPDSPCCDNAIPRIRFRGGSVPHLDPAVDKCQIKTVIDLKWNRRLVGFPSVPTWSSSCQTTQYTPVVDCLGASAFDAISLPTVGGSATLQSNIINGGDDARVKITMHGSGGGIANASSGDDYSANGNVSGSVSCELLKPKVETLPASLVVGRFEVELRDCTDDVITLALAGGTDDAFFVLNGTTLSLDPTHGSPTRPGNYYVKVQATSTECPNLIIPIINMVLSHTVIPTANVVGN